MIYLAGPLFSLAERTFNSDLAAELRGLGHSVFLPQEHVQEGAQAIFASDMIGLINCDVVVAILDGSDPDSGTAWECGWAYAMGIPVIGVRTDFRQSGEEGVPVNLMLTCSARTVIWEPKMSLPVLGARIEGELDAL